MSNTKQRHAMTAEKRRLKKERQLQNREAREFSSSMSSLFQFLWVLVIAPRTFYYLLVPAPALVDYTAIFFLFIAVYNQILIYYPLFGSYILRKKIPNRLITTGFFKYTRHPMYSAVLIADALFMFYAPWDWKMILHTVAFYAITVVACYFHEQDVLYDFREKAVEYYNKTPRLFFMYPFKKWILW